MADRPRSRDGIWFPDMDCVSTDQLRREISTLREIVETRITAIDRATELFHATLTLYPTDVDKQIGQLRALHDARLEALERSLAVSISTITMTYDRTMAERDLRYQQRYDASDKAIEKAEISQHTHNLAQNEWRSTINDITRSVADNARADTVSMGTALRTNIEITTRALTEKIDSNQARLDRTEGRMSQSNSTQTTMLSAAAIAVSLLIGGFSIFSGMRKAEETRPVIYEGPLSPQTTPQRLTQ